MVFSWIIPTYLMLGSHPASNRNLTISLCPLVAARWSKVVPWAPMESFKMADIFSTAVTPSAALVLPPGADPVSLGFSSSGAVVKASEVDSLHVLSNLPLEFFHSSGNNIRSHASFSFGNNKFRFSKFPTLHAVYTSLRSWHISGSDSLITDPVR